MSQTVKEQAVRADRPNRGLPYDQLVVIKTIDASITSLPLRRYELVIQAAEKYRDEIRRADPDMIEWMRILKSLTYSFIYAREEAQASKVSMAWNLRAGDYAKFVHPWVKDINISWLADYTNRYDEQLSQNENSFSDEQRFLAISHAYSIQTFDYLRNSFMVWAAPIISDMEREVEEIIGVIPKAVLESIMVKNEK